MPTAEPAADVSALAAALGDAPPVVRAEAFVYPGAVPAFEPAEGAPRPAPAGDRLRLYVHVPFCNYRCSFCHFSVRVDASREHHERFVAGVERELAWVEPGTRLTQLFVGGGTPTALPPPLLDRLLAAVFARAEDAGEHVHTVEASPDSITEEHVAVLAARGVGRVSMGVQSLDDDVLDGVARGQRRSQVGAAIDRVLDAGLILNVDLMYGLPGQTEEGFGADVAGVASRGVHSVTLYGLRVRDTSLADLAELLRWRRIARDAAEAHGFRQVRPHTFKRPGTVADRHERVRCFDREVRGLQLGVGPSARSSLGDDVFRNHRGLLPWLARVEAGRSPVDARIALSDADRRTKFLARSLGEGHALAKGAYASVFGRAFEDDYAETLGRLLRGGLLEDRDGALRMTALGRLLYDRVLVSFYPEWARAWLSRAATSSGAQPASTGSSTSLRSWYAK